MRAPTALLLTFVVACAEGEGTPVPETTYVSANSYCERTVDGFCAFYSRCQWMAVDDEATCRARFLESCNGRYEPLYEALESAGLLRLTSAGVAACVEHLAQVACERQVGDLDGPCAAMWEGQQAAGGACGMGAAGIESLVCAPGTRCSLDLSFCGSCQPVAGLGEPCALDSDCEVAAACVDDRCVARAGLGEACVDVPCVSGARCEGDVCALRHTRGGPGATCAGDLDCQYALACVGQECVATAALGEPCDAATPCDAGVCAAGSCEPFTLPDQPCVEHSECVSGACDGVCAAVPGACF